MIKWLWAYAIGIPTIGCIVVAQNVFELKAADWAAWAQAIGTVFAVAAAVAIAYQQNAQQQRREDARELAQDLRSYHLLQSIVVRLYSTLQIAARNLNDEAYSDTLARKLRRRDGLIQIKMALYELPVHALPEFDAVAGLIDARTLAVKALDSAEAIVSDVESRAGSASHGAAWKDLFKEADHIFNELSTAAKWKSTGIPRDER